jgi:hypothetical protein
MDSPFLFDPIKFATITEMGFKAMIATAGKDATAAVE